MPDYMFNAIEWAFETICPGDKPTKEQVAKEFGDDPDGFVLECAEARARGWIYFRDYIKVYNQCFKTRYK